MDIYYYLLMTPLLIGWVAKIYVLLGLKEKIANMLVTILTTIAMFLGYANRAYTVGTDTSMYRAIFRYTVGTDVDWSILGQPNNIEIGYRLLNKVIGLFSDNPHIFFVTVGALLFGGFAFYFYWESPTIWSSFFLFIGLGFYTETFNTLRQVLAIVIILNNIRFLIDGRLVKWIVGIIIASFFHLPAILFLIFTPLGKMNEKMIRRYVWLAVIGPFLLAFITSLLTDYLAGSKYILYFSMESANGSLGDCLRIVAFVLLLIGGWGNRNKFVGREKAKLSVYMIMIVFAISSTICEQFVPGFYRFTLYFSVFICVFLPIVFGGFSPKNRMISYMIMVPAVTYAFMRILSQNGSQLYYRFF